MSGVEYVGIPRDLLPTLQTLVNEALAQREVDYDKMRARADADPSDVLIADQVHVTAHRLAAARMVSREVDNATPAAPLPF